MTLEIYYVNSCQQLLSGPFVFGQISLTDLNNNGLTPNWSPTNAAACNSQLTVNGNSITIEQNLSSGRSAK